MNTKDKLSFKDGTSIKVVEKAKYLGVWLHNRADQKVEINERIRQSMAVWRRMHKYWTLGRCSKKTKLRVWNAVICSKLTYALHTVQLNPAEMRKLDAFQRRGLRKIMKWSTTYVNRENTNEELLKEANKIIKEGTQNKKEVKEMEWVSEILKKRSNTYFGHILREEENEPTRTVAFIKDMPNLGWRRRKGRPRKNWIEEMLSEAWHMVKEEYQGEDDMAEDLPDFKNAAHMRRIRRGAEERLF